MHSYELLWRYPTQATKGFELMLVCVLCEQFIDVKFSTWSSTMVFSPPFSQLSKLLSDLSCLPNRLVTSTDRGKVTRFKQFKTKEVQCRDLDLQLYIFSQIHFLFRRPQMAMILNVKKREQIVAPKQKFLSS